MRFNPKARIDRGQIQSRSGGRSGGRRGGGMRLPIPTGGRGGKVGLGTVVLAVLFVVVTQALGVDLGGSGAAPGAGSDPAANTCSSGADANQRDECAIDLFTTSVQDYWERTYPEQTGEAYDVAQTIRFRGGTGSDCGPASAQMGPFYCPTDQRVYLDATFFDDMLEGQLGAEGGQFAIGYVIAHEYGHHVEDQLGYLDRIRTRQGARSDAVRVELMADCLAGMWAGSAEQTRDAKGLAIITDLTQEDIRLAVDAAQAVGDDRIQKRGSGRVDTDTFTHGSAAQRVRWFNRGLAQGSLRACDTFATDDL